MNRSTGPGLLFAILVSCCSAPAQDSSADAGNRADTQDWPPPAYLAADAMFESIPEVRWDDSGVLVLSDRDGAEPIAIDPETGTEVPYRPQPETGGDEARVVRPGFFAHRRPVLELPSPDSGSFAGTSGGEAGDEVEVEWHPS